MQEQLGDVNQTVEKDVLDESVAQVANLVVTAMKSIQQDQLSLVKEVLMRMEVEIILVWEILMNWIL